MPNAANLNLYRGWKSCVGWHRDDEPLFGECGEAKLIVSVSHGSSAVCRWRRQSCPDDEGHLCCLGWVANARTSSLIARTLVGNRSGLMLRSVGSGSILLPAHCGLSHRSPQSSVRTAVAARADSTPPGHRSGRLKS